ncbi:MAG: tetratricopeptide repeat protein [bacterium]
MKANRLSLPVLALVTAWLAAFPLTAQTQNAQAVKWFQAALNASGGQAKIDAYTRALAFDSTMVEAHYNLAAVYKQQSDFQNAEKHLLQASTLEPNRPNAELKNRILYDLASVYRRQNKTRQAEEILRQAKQHIKDVKMLSSVYFELSKILIEQNRYDEALTELRSGQQLDPSNKTFFSNLIQIAENAAAMDKQYEQARQAEARGAYQEAQAQYNLISSQNPEFRDVAARTAHLDSMISQAAHQERLLATAFEQALEYEAQGKLELAIPVYENLLLQSGGDYKETRARLEQARQQLELRQREEKITAEYSSGLAALSGQNWTRAILAFEQVLTLNPDYREAREKLAEAQAQLKRESNETIAARYYADGITAMERNDPSAASAAFQKISEINPGYRDVASRLTRVENQLQQARTAEAPALSGHVETLYAEAQAAIAKQDWMQAVIRLETIQVLRPNHRDVIDLLVQARVKLSLASQSPTEERGSNWLVMAGIALAAIVLPILGMAAFSSTFRARYYLLRGNHAAAAGIFEELLAKHPERAKLNPTLVNTLSNYYLLSGRTDDRALEIYETAQLSRSAGNSPRQEELDYILKQHGRMHVERHEDALSRLENRLKNHQFQAPSSNH